jgi:hypothetical protein
MTAFPFDEFVTRTRAMHPNCVEFATYQFTRSSQSCDDSTV